MSRRVLFEANEQGTLEDFNNLGLFTEAAFDAVGEGLLIPDMAYWGFDVAAQGTTTVVVGPGNIMVDGKTYVNDDESGTEFNLLSRLPVAARKYVTLVAWGVEMDENIDPRAFLTDVTTRSIEAKLTPTNRVRRAELALISGIEEPDPQPAAPAAGQVAICDILLDTSGIVDDGGVTMNQDNLAPNLRSLYLLARAFDVWRIRIGVLIDTLASDLARLAGRIGGLAERSLVIGVIEQLSEVKDAVGLPDDYSAWASDQFLDYEDCDIEHVAWHALVEDGLRFPYQSQTIAQLGLLNSLDAKVAQFGGYMMPAYSLVERVAIVGRDDEVSISSIETSSVTAVQKSITRSRVRYGCTYIPTSCAPRWHDWDGPKDKKHHKKNKKKKNKKHDPAVSIFCRRGENPYGCRVKDHLPWPGDWWPCPGDEGDCHKFERLEYSWVDEWTEYYWENVTTTTTYPGSIIAQTFLNSQEGWLCAVDLYFTRKASVGDVKILICETSDSGQPLVDACIGSATLDPEDIHIYPVNTRVAIQPTALKVGKRYAVVLVSNANHYLAIVDGNKFSSGSMFTSTDNTWFQGDLLKDISMRLVFARFSSPRIEVQMQPLANAGGIVNIDINADTVVPDADGFAIVHEIQKPITGEWIPLNATLDNELITLGVNALPPALMYRIVFLGTTEMMPCIGLGSNSETYCWKPDNDFTYISEDRVMPANTTANTVYVTLRLEGWLGDVSGGGHHTCTITLMTGSGFSVDEVADSVTDEAAQDDPLGAIYRKAVFTPSDVSEYKIKVEGTTDNVVTCFHIAERIDVALDLGT